MPEELAELQEAGAAVEESPEVAETTEPKTEETTEAASGDDDGSEDDGKPHWMKQRLKKVSQQKNRLRQEVEALRSQLAQAEQQLEQAKKQDVSGMSEDERIEHRLSIKQEEQRLAQAKQTVSAQEMQAKAQAFRDNFADRIGELPHFNEAMTEAGKYLSWDGATTTEIMDFVYESDIGADLIYHLTTNEDLGNQLTGKTGRQLDRALLRLESQLRLNNPYPKRQQKTTATKAPAPPTSVKGETNGRVLSLDKLSGDAYYRERKRQIANGTLKL
jgi:hypothetical protein